MQNKNQLSNLLVVDRQQAQNPHAHQNMVVSVPNPNNSQVDIIGGSGSKLNFQKN